MPSSTALKVRQKFGACTKEAERKDGKSVVVKECCIVKAQGLSCSHPYLSKVDRR
jgi:hypothetical protein